MQLSHLGIVYFPVSKFFALDAPTTTAQLCNPLSTNYAKMLIPQALYYQLLMKM
jgi:hypothetical protein